MKKYNSTEEYYKDKYPDLYLEADYLYKLFNNTNFLNNQNYTVSKNNKFNIILFIWNIKRINNSYKVDYFSKIFFRILRKKSLNLVLFHKVRYWENEYLVIKRKYYNSFFS